MVSFWTAANVPLLNVPFIQNVLTSKEIAVLPLRDNSLIVAAMILSFRSLPLKHSPTVPCVVNTMPVPIWMELVAQPLMASFCTAVAM